MKQLRTLFSLSLMLMVGTVLGQSFTFNSNSDLSHSALAGKAIQTSPTSITITDRITIGSRMNLSIEPGMTINFEPSAGIRVTFGTLSPMHNIHFNGGQGFEINYTTSEFYNCEFSNINSSNGSPIFTVNGENGLIAKDCNFHDNYGVHGGGIFTHLSTSVVHDVEITGCTFTNCSSGTGGAGAVKVATYAGEGNVLIQDNVFEGNYTTGYGGALLLHATPYQGTPDTDYKVYNNVFRNNKSTSHGGAIAYSFSIGEFGHTDISNNLIVHNEGAYGGAVYIGGKNVALRNNTIAYNLGTASIGGVYRHSSNGTASAYSNNIVWDNKDQDGARISNFFIYNSYEIPFENNIINEGRASMYIVGGDYSHNNNSHEYYNVYADGTSRNNLECDPRFVNVPSTVAGLNANSTQFDFSIKSNSPAVNAGVTTSFVKDNQANLLNNEDLLHAATPYDGLVDIGAFEFAGTPTTVAPCLGADFGPCVLEVFGLNNDASCLGNDGSIDLTVSGAIGNLTFAWSNGSITEDITGLVAGTYTVTVTDDGTPACSEEQSFTIIATTLGNPIVDLSSESMTNGLTPNGSVEAIVSGGTGTYSFLWNEGSTTEGLADLSAGIYSVEVVDKGTGCEASGAVEVSDVSPVFGAIELSPCPPKGTLNFIVRSGVGPFVAKVSKSHHITGASEGYIRLDWEKHEEVSFAGGVEVSLLLDTKGHYNLEIYDANDELVLVYEFSVTTSTWNKDCTAAERGRGEGNKRVGSFEEETSIELEGVENLVFGMYPNPASRDLTVSLSEELEEATIEIYNTVGSRVLVETMTSQRSQLDVSDLVNGMYFVRLRSNNTLIKQQSFVVAH